MSMFRDINFGWNYRQFNEFAQLVHANNKSQDKNVHDFIEWKKNVIPWKLCKEAEPELRRIIQQPTFKETGHYETAIALCDAMRKCADKKVDLEV